MKNVFLKTKYFHPILGFLSLLLMGCPPVKRPSLPPNLIIIGEDLSGTYDNFPASTDKEIQEICDSLAKIDSGSKIYFIGIGEERPKDYVTCTITPGRPMPDGATPSEKIKILKYNQSIKEKNQTNVGVFISGCREIFKKRNQRHTDINGFIEKAASIINAPNHKKFTKWLYINSDGKQDTPSSVKVNCDLLPSQAKLFLNKGWKKDPDCSPQAKVLDTSEFIQILMDGLREALTEIKNRN